jgi:hypothetical protein
MSINDIYMYNLKNNNKKTAHVPITGLKKQNTFSCTPLQLHSPLLQRDKHVSTFYVNLFAFLYCSLQMVVPPNKKKFLFSLAVWVFCIMCHTVYII